MAVWKTIGGIRKGRCRVATQLGFSFEATVAARSLPSIQSEEVLASLCLCRRA
jgi:hypothetical protein